MRIFLEVNWILTITFLTVRTHREIILLLIIFVVAIVDLCVMLYDILFSLVKKFGGIGSSNFVNFN